LQLEYQRSTCASAAPELPDLHRYFSYSQASRSRSIRRSVKILAPARRRAAG
jgi:hypothetical protein